MSAGHADTDHDQARAVSATAMLVGLATLLLGVYSTLAALSFRFGPESVPAERPVLLMLGLLGIAFIAYLLSIRVALSSREGMPLLATILLAGVLMRGVSLLAWPILEVDINRYIWDGAVVLEGVSPYRYSPAQVLVAAPHAHLPEDLRRLVELRDGSTSRQTILSRIHYRELPTIYPPVSQAVFAVAVLVTPANASVLAHILVMKTALVLFDLGTLAVLLGLLRMAKWHSGWAVAYGWCPLVIKETANSGHLDSVAVFFTTLALYFALKPLASRVRGRHGLGAAMMASAALSLAVGAKLYPIVLAPMFVWLWHRTLGAGWAAVISIAFFAATTLVLWPMVPVKSEVGSWANIEQASADKLAPPTPAGLHHVEPQDPSGGLKAFLRGWEMNDFLFLILIENTKPTNAADPARPPWFSITPESWKAQLVSRFSRWLGTERAEAAFFLTRLLTGIVFVVIALSLLSTSRSSDDPAAWLRVAFLTLAWFWLLSPTQNPWYWTWALPLVMFARSRVWLAVSGLAMIYYLRFWLVYHWPEQPVPGTAYTGPQLFDFVVTWLEYGPWFVCLAWVGIRARAIRES